MIFLAANLWQWLPRQGSSWLGRCLQEVCLTWAAQHQTLEKTSSYILLGLSKSECDREKARKIETGVRSVDQFSDWMRVCHSIEA
jgi:hypothetical protein